ncbi:hypothetical protein HNQ92_003171 [Rhabdobacter roseus]|uniref:Uncharacterized protein n=1 Tax=Rhabdobacter roseus TaxID=1655419 RepID=A0A840TUS9_9BACT|nr:hypothetical protein [Rhabdobacter roseus]MBB5285023.1 hypothetical protein [Rhabdobacter roseus]
MKTNANAQAAQTPISWWEAPSPRLESRQKALFELIDDFYCVFGRDMAHEHLHELLTIVFGDNDEKEEELQLTSKAISDLATRTTQLMVFFARLAGVWGSLERISLDENYIKKVSQRQVEA